MNRLIIIDSTSCQDVLPAEIADALNNVAYQANGSEVECISLPETRSHEVLSLLDADKLIVVLSSLKLNFVKASELAVAIREKAPHAYIIGLSGTPEHFDETAFDTLLTRSFKFLESLDFVAGLFVMAFANAKSRI